MNIINLQVMLPKASSFVWKASSFSPKASSFKEIHNQL